MTFDLKSLGFDAFRDAYAERGNPSPGRVIRTDRGICSLLTGEGAERSTLGGAVLATAARNPAALPCAGDWVAVQEWPDGRSTIEAVLPRRTAVIRATAGKEAAGQVLASNVDAVAVVASVDPEPDLGRIERLLAVAWNSGAQPLIILTKADLAVRPKVLVKEVSRLAPGIPVYAVSATSGAGMDAVTPYVRYGQTLALVGASGAGKSTLVNALAGATVMRVQTIRDADGKGRHTTTYRALVPVPGGGAVLDTPGLRGVGMFVAESTPDGPHATVVSLDGIDRTFADVVGYAAFCRFRDCSHEAEPGCAVTAAVDAGELPPRRLESWRKLQRELAYETRRRDTRAGLRGGGWRLHVRQHGAGGSGR